jgi:hypothetical protein
MMNTPINEKGRPGPGWCASRGPGASRKFLFVLLLALGTGAIARAQNPADQDILFLRDGSVLQGSVLRDSGGTYHVHNPLFGTVAVEESAVLYRLPGRRDAPILSESHVIFPGSLEVITSFSRPIPPREGENEEFHLLVPGAVDNVHRADGRPVRFRRRDIAGSSLVTIEYRDIGNAVDRVYLSSVQKEILHQREDGSLEFRTKRILNEAGTVRLMVEYPQEWSVRSASPKPSFQTPGMIVWEAALRRQETFLPTVFFEIPDPQAASAGGEN